MNYISLTIIFLSSFTWGNPGKGWLRNSNPPTTSRHVNSVLVHPDGYLKKKIKLNPNKSDNCDRFKQECYFLYLNDHDNSEMEFNQAYGFASRGHSEQAEFKFMVLWFKQDPKCRVITMDSIQVSPPVSGPNSYKVDEVLLKAIKERGFYDSLSFTSESCSDPSSSSNIKLPSNFYKSYWSSMSKLSENQYYADANTRCTPRLYISAIMCDPVSYRFIYMPSEGNSSPIELKTSRPTEAVLLPYNTNQDYFYTSVECEM